MCFTETRQVYTSARYNMNKTGHGRDSLHRNAIIDTHCEHLDLDSLAFPNADTEHSLANE